MKNIINIIKKTNYYYNLASFAGLEDELDKLEISSEIKDFIKSIDDPGLKGRLFSELKKNLNITLNELKIKQTQILESNKKKQELKESSIPEGWEIVFNSIPKEHKLYIFLHRLARNKKLPKFSKEVENKLKIIKHYIDENIKEFIDNLNFDELYEKSKEWENSFKEAKQLSYEKIDIVYGPEWKNSNFNGYFITKITTENDLKLEGSLLEHCVGGYYYKIKNKESEIFSLRNPAGKPEVTIETSIDHYQFKQTFGRNNAQPNSTQTSMINEWKQHLHPVENILNLINSKNKSDQIKAAQFMDYNNPIYKNIIDSMLESENDSGLGFIGSATANEPKDVLQALAANETLNNKCYNLIYDKAKNNDSTIFNLIRNYKLDDELFIKIFIENKNKKQILNAIASSFALGRSYLLDDIVSFILEKNDDTLSILLNNPSIKSTYVKNILNNMSEENIAKLFSNNQFVKNFEPKFIDDILESKNIYLNKYLLQILWTNENLNNKLIEKFYQKYGEKKINVSKTNLLTKLLQKDAFQILLGKNDDYINVNLAKNSNLTTEQIQILLGKNYDYINKNLAKTSNLTTEQFQILLDKNDYNINKNLAKNSNLTTEQFQILLNKNDVDININLAKNSNLTTEQFQILLGKNDVDINMSLATNSNLTTEQIQILLDKNDVGININLAKNSNLTTEQTIYLITKNIIPNNLSKKLIKKNASKYDFIINMADFYLKSIKLA